MLKTIRQWMTGTTVTLITKLATTTAGMTCIGPAYQPKCPISLKK